MKIRTTTLLGGLIAPFLLGLQPAVSQTYATLACHNFNGGNPPGTTGQNATIMNQTPGPSNVATDGYLHAVDMCGVSYAQVPIPGNLNNWCALMSTKCLQLCFDLRLFNDGWASNVSTLNPVIRIGNNSNFATATIVAEFTCSQTITEQSGWQSYCAPVWKSNAAGLPANSAGSWKIIKGVPPNATQAQINNAWDSLICNTNFSGGVQWFHLFLDNTVNPSDLYGV